MEDKLIDIDHLDKAEANWLTHFYKAMYFNGIGLLMVITGIIHAFFPQLFGFLPYKLAKKITDGTEKNFPGCLKDANKK